VLPDEAAVDTDAASSADGAVVDEGGAVVTEDGAVVAVDGGSKPPIADAGPAPTADAGGIKCGTATCDSTTQVCCASFSGSSCVAKGSCTGATLSCSDPSSCAAGQVCCATGGGGGGGARCQTTCSGATLCSKDADCRSGQLCVAATGGYKICRNPPPDGGPPMPPG